MNMNVRFSKLKKKRKKERKKLGFVYSSFKVKDLNFLDYEFVHEKNKLLLNDYMTI